MPWIWVLEHRRDAAVVADHEGIQPPPRVLVVATDNVLLMVTAVVDVSGVAPVEEDYRTSLSMVEG